MMRLMAAVQVEVDPAALDAFPAQMREKMSFKDMFGLIEQPDFKELRHLPGIKHEMDMIAQIIGQAPGDRGGMPESPTATDSIACWFTVIWALMSCKLRTRPSKVP